MSGIQQKELHKVFETMRGLCDLFSTKAKPIGSGFSGVAIDMGHGTISKFYRNNVHGQDVNKKQLLNEAYLLDKFNGRVGEFKTPVLTDEPVLFPDDHPLKSSFVGYISMEKLKGSVIEWDRQPHHLTKSEWEYYYYQVGALIASIHLSAHNLEIDCLSEMGEFPFLANWVTDPETISVTKSCMDWFNRHKIEAFAHADISGRNIIATNNGKKVSGVLDFSLSGIFPNQHIDFLNIDREWLSMVNAGYQSISGQSLNMPLIEITKLIELGFQIQKLTDSNKDGSKDHELNERKLDFKLWAKSLANDLALQ